MHPALQQTLFILNQSSGRRKSNILLDEIKKRKLHYFISRSANEFFVFLENLNPQYKTIVICGGDGTINNIVNQMHGLNVVFAIYPGGSGNGLARELGFENNFEDLLTSIQKGHTQYVDLIKINEHYCLNMAGIGFDAYVAHRFDTGTKRGFRSYINETIKALRKYKVNKSTIALDQQEVKDEFFMINIANTRQFGNNAYIAPNAQFNDGIIEVVLIKKMPFYVLPTFLYRLFTATLRPTKYVSYYQAQEVSIQSTAAHYHIDGEPLLFEQPLQIKIDKQLRFITPL